MVSRYRPPTPERSLGAQKTAVAEWKTEMFVAVSVVGQRVRGGVPGNVMLGVVDRRGTVERDHQGQLDRYVFRALRMRRAGIL